MMCGATPSVEKTIHLKTTSEDGYLKISLSLTKFSVGDGETCSVQL